MVQESFKDLLFHYYCKWSWYCVLNLLHLRSQIHTQGFSTGWYYFLWFQQYQLRIVCRLSSYSFFIFINNWGRGIYTERRQPKLDGGEYKLEPLDPVLWNMLTEYKIHLFMFLSIAFYYFLSKVATIQFYLYFYIICN